MRRQNDINFLKATGILMSVIIVIASLIFYSLNENSTLNYSRPITAVGQEQRQVEPDNSIDENETAAGSSISELSLPELFSKVEKSVVQVANKEEAGITLGGRLGSGFVYDKNGHIVTNYHVITGSAAEGNVQITFLDGSTYNARLVGGDPFADLAVLRLEGENIPEDKLVPLPIGDSTTLRVGEQVVAIGNPFGLSGSMTEGIISGLGRMLPSAEQGEESDIIPSDLDSPSGFLIPDIIQTDAPINPGNSGGPLLNTQGEVIGINTAIFSTTGASAGVGFAIPSNTIKKVIPSLITKGTYQHPYLGIVGTDITPEIAEALGLVEARGFLVTDVSNGSPAQKAGIRGGNSLTNVAGRGIAMGGDVILKIDENTVRKLDDVLTYLEREKKVGDNVQLTVLRNGEVENVDLTLGPRPTLLESQSQRPLGSLPPQEENVPQPNQDQEQQPPLADQLYNQCIEIAGKDICDFMFQR
ncbi:MAG: trypsin-like peptidase domain-containing protein [Thermoproteota archaeon]|jgi:S1-C subfamily serine protease|nr:trypsin-like peptidase domain-containing protein [Thermoproteota archaeon]